MNKAILERFISKYSLNGAAESVFLVTEKGSLSTKFITDDKNAIGTIKTSDFSFDDGTYAVYETARLSGLLSVLSDDIRVKVNKDKGTAKSLLLSDGSARVTFVLADPSTIPPVPNATKLPTFDASIKLDQKFLTTFVKAKNGLPEIETFTVLGNGKAVQIILGHSELNVHNVAFEVDSNVTTLEPINFSARYMKDLLLANKEAVGGTMEVSSKGLAHISFKFESDNFSAEYYLVAIASE